MHPGNGAELQQLIHKFAQSTHTCRQTYMDHISNTERMHADLCWAVVAVGVPQKMMARLVLTVLPQCRY